MNQIFAPFFFRNYCFFHLGQTANLMGTLLFQLGLNWWLFEKTHSVMLSAILNAALQFPILILNPLMSDWIKGQVRKTINRKIHSLQIIFYALVIVAYWTQWLVPESILLIGLVGGMLNAAEIMIKQDLVPRLVPHQCLAQSLSINSLFSNLVRLIGPLSASFLLFYSGPLGCLIFGFFCYIWMRVTLEFMEWSGIEEERNGRKSSGIQETVFQKWISNVKYGWSIVEKNKDIKRVIIWMGVLNFFLGGYATIVPALAKNEGGSYYANLMMMTGAGSFVSVIGIVMFQVRLRLKDFLIPLLFVLMGAFFVALKSYYMNYLAMFCVGGGMISFVLLGSIFMQERVDPKDRLHLMGIFAMLTLGVVPLGNLWLGIISSVVSVEYSLLMSSILGLIMMFFWKLRSN